jgi:lysozyme
MAMQPVSSPDYKLIDISHNNGAITDWPTVKGQTDGVYEKATESTTFTDPMFNSNATGAINAGISVGFYHFFWPRQSDTSNAYYGLIDAQQQADYFYSITKGYSNKLINMIDVEQSNHLTADNISADVKAFCEEYKRISGQPVIIYSYVSFINNYLNSTLSSYPLWIAHYTSQPEPGNTTTWSNWTAWQYSDSGKITGISSLVDLDKATSGIFISTPLSSTNSISSNLKKGASGTVVKALQEQLNKQGFKLSVDGNFGAKTQAAVESFQRSHGLTVDGIVGPKTSAALTATTTKSSPTYDSNIKAIQHKINTLKIAALTEDGINGSKTKAAAAAFEKIMGISQDGVWGAQCQSRYDQITARPTIKAGQTNNQYAVRYIQYRTGVTIAGSYNTQTVNVVKNFQAKKGLKKDGVVGPKTWAALLG